MYKIIGANQVEYGPITAEQLRQWIAEGRVNAQTSAQAVGETGWRPISSFPEFASSFPGAAASSQPSATIPAGQTPPPFGTTPAGASVSADAGRAQAVDKITPPSIALLVSSILTILFALLGIGMNLAGINGAQFSRFQDMGNQNPQFEKMMAMSSGTLGVVFAFINLGVAIFILFAALKMKKLESHSMAMAASILSIIPCITPCPCCCLGIPIGIWALIVLNKPEVKGYFSN